MNHTKIIINFNILNPLSKGNRETITPMHKKLCCLNDRAKRMQDLRVVDKYFLIKLVTWTRKQDLRVVDKYFLIKLVTWTRNEIVNTYQSRSGKNQINFFFASIIGPLRKWESVLPGTKVGWSGGRRGGGAIRQRFETLKCVTYVRSPVKVVGRVAWNLRYCALGSKLPPFTHELAREEAGTTTCFSSLHRAMDKYIGKIERGASSPFWPWQD